MERKSANKVGGILLLSTPVFSLALFIAVQFITVGVQGLTADFWTNTLINTVTMLLAFVPLYQWGINRFKQSEKTEKKRDAFNRLFTEIKDGNGLKALREYSKYEVEYRKNTYVSGQLQHADITAAEYGAKYQALSKKQIRETPELLPYQKRILRKLKRNLKFYAVNVDKLYSSQIVTERRRMGKTLEQQQARDIAAKIVNALAFGAVAAMLAFQALQDVDVAAVIVNTLIRLLILAYNCGMAVVAARNNVENVYCGHITAQTVFLSEFLEFAATHAKTEEPEGKQLQNTDLHSGEQ